MELTDPISDYIIKKVTNLGKLIKKIQEAGGEVSIYFEVAKTTNHHKSGQVYKSDCSVTIDGENFYTSSEDEDLYASIDACKDKLFRDIRRKKERKWALFKKGASKIKNLVRSAKFWK